MKMTGNYSGDTSLDERSQVEKSTLLSRLHCGIVLLGQWTLVVQGIISMFFEGLAEIKSFYFLLLFSTWYLQCACFSTVANFTLSKSLKKPSRFSQFIDSFISTAFDFNSVKKQTLTKMLALVWCIVAFNTSCLTFLDLYRQNSVARFRPWNGLLVYRILHLIFATFDGFALALPFLLFSVSCVFLADMFETFHKKILTENPISLKIGSLRQEHQRLCETVALADKLFSPFLFMLVSFNVPLICINFHQGIRSAASTKRNIAFVITVLHWFFGLTGQLAIALVFGMRVNEKVRFLFFISSSTPA